MDNDNNPPKRAPENTYRNSGENKFVEQLKKPVVFVSLILLLLLLGLYLYKESQLNDVREQAAMEREQAAMERAAVIERANQQISENNRYLLETLMKPFSWALRTALLSGNTEQVDQYLFQFVQEDRFALLVVADADGTIISSTDQNFTGAAFSDHFNPEYLAIDSTVVDDSNQERVVVVSPLMGLNSKVGTLLAVYRPAPPIQQQSVEEEVEE
ncbi:PDC sensor domain-containing protein [Pontibacter pamirensis]|uniref:PDC sensor domain-containing protein n=1 Tax=Pontibacter pamirensis TaxID=2562824 RepID=UPI00138A1EB5|nr:PDC sensor domain-containing protein [Pontibacter pamirensis]